MHAIYMHEQAVQLVENKLDSLTINKDTRSSDTDIAALYIMSPSICQTPVLLRVRVID